MITDTSFLVESVNPVLLAATSCPAWCAEPDGHGTSDGDIFRARELVRHHIGSPRLMVAQPHYGRPVTAKLSRFAAIELEGNADAVYVEPASIQLSELPECGLTSAEVRELATALLKLADEVDAG